MHNARNTSLLLEGVPALCSLGCVCASHRLPERVHAQSGRAAGAPELGTLPSAMLVVVSEHCHNIPAQDARAQLPRATTRGPIDAVK